MRRPPSDILMFLRLLAKRKHTHADLITHQRAPTVRLLVPWEPSTTVDSPSLSNRLIVHLDPVDSSSHGSLVLNTRKSSTHDVTHTCLTTPVVVFSLDHCIRHWANQVLFFLTISYSINYPCLIFLPVCTILCIQIAVQPVSCPRSIEQRVWNSDRLAKSDFIMSSPHHAYALHRHELRPHAVLVLLLVLTHHIWDRPGYTSYRSFGQFFHR